MHVVKSYKLIEKCCIYTYQCCENGIKIKELLEKKVRIFKILP